MNTIPKIIHQIWIGPKPAPTKFMNTWKNKNPDYEYICWTEDKIKELNFTFKCQKIIDKTDLYHGKADIMRLEILYKYGGIYLDADSICVEPLDNDFINNTAFATYENEIKRGDLVANGNMGFIPGHPLCLDAINYILDKNNLQYILSNPPWISLGPGLLTKLLKTGKYTKFVVYPSLTFLPLHFTGEKYEGHKKVYAYQEWGSTKENYSLMNEIQLPHEYTEPKLWVSVLVSSYNTKAKYIQECLDSIKNQNGHFGIELVWINDGSTELNTRILKTFLNKFQFSTRFTKVVYIENDRNRGLGYTFNKGNILCSNDIIFRMDSDDIMLPDRLKLQIEYMVNNQNVMICGGQVNCFNSNGEITSSTSHKSLSVEEYKKNPSHWFLNHPTVCYRKKAILEVGNYNINISRMAEDFELWLRFLKKYGYIHNMSEVLLNYRLHEEQLTHQGGKEGRPYWHNLRNTMIQNIIMN